MTRTVEDAAVLASILTGHDPLDGTSLASGPIDTSALARGLLRGARVGLVEEFQDVEPRVAACLRTVETELGREGAWLVDVSLPSIRHAVTIYYLIAPAEASSNLARFDGVRYGERVEGECFDEMVARTRGTMLGHEVKARIMMGTYALSAGYAGQLYERLPFPWGSSRATRWRSSGWIA
jgi:aspartyl-tRNA(Asn)/glutamyl-tRNA(Gln) amidotransferase subunit A